MLRKVTAGNFSVAYTDASTSATRAINCFRYKTEDLHPVEIFEAFTVDSELSHPFSVTYMPLPSEDGAMLGEHYVSDLEFNTLYTAPVPCSDITKWSTGEYGASTSQDSSFYLITGYNYACLDYVEDMPGSFNMNYDPITGKAVGAFPLGSDDAEVTGVVCSSCYAYMGAQFKVHIEYSYMSGFAFLTSLSGGTGANVRVDATDPRISGMVNSSLMEAATEYNVAIVTTGKYIQSDYTQRIPNFK
jgi:hypothetical protein